MTTGDDGQSPELPERKPGEGEREVPFAAVLDLLSDTTHEILNPIAVTDVHGVIVYANRPFCEMTGHAVHELTGKGMATLVDEAGEPRTGLWRELREGRAWRGELHGAGRDGTDFWTSASISPVRNSRSKTTHFLWINEDITERRRAEETLHRLMRQPSDASHVEADFVMIVDVDGKILFINKTVEGISTGEAIGSALRDYVAPEDMAVIESRLERVFRTGRPDVYQVSGTGPRGSTVRYQSHIGPIRHGRQVVAAAIASVEVSTSEAGERDLDWLATGLRELGDQLRTPALVCRLDGTILYANSSMAELLGRSIEEVLAKRPWDLVAPEFRGQVIERMRARQRGETPRPRQMRIAGEDGEERWMEATSSVVELFGERLMLVTATDVTRLKRLMEASGPRQPDAAGVQPRTRARGDGARSSDCEPVRGSPAEEFGLSRREMEVLWHLAQGMTNAEIGESLAISRRTVDHHVAHILTKIDASNRAAAVLAAERAGVLERVQPQD